MLNANWLLCYICILTGRIGDRIAAIYPLSVGIIPHNQHFTETSSSSKAEALLEAKASSALLEQFQSRCLQRSGGANSIRVGLYLHLPLHSDRRRNAPVLD